MLKTVYESFGLRMFKRDILRIQHLFFILLTARMQRNINLKKMTY